jgi:hypothetical protein
MKRKDELSQRSGFRELKKKRKRETPNCIEYEIASTVHSSAAPSPVSPARPPPPLGTSFPGKGQLG